MVLVPKRYMDSYATYLIGAGVPKSKVEDCMEWAFGSGWEKAELGNLRERWNKRQNLFEITNDMQIDQTLFKIGLLYCVVVLKTTGERNV